jgi:LuxR family maltose regulon positive regulatory protein
MKGEVAIAENWIDMLPERYLRIYPSVCMNKAWVMYRTGRLREVEHLLSQVRKILDSPTIISKDEIAGMNGEITAIHAAILDLNGNNTDAIQLLQSTIENLPENQIFSRCICKLFLTQSMARAEGYTEETANIFNRSISLCKETGNLENFMLIITGVVNELVKKYIWQGYLSKAESIITDAFSMIQDEKLDKLPTVSYLYNSLGKVFLEQYDLKKAEACLLQGLTLDSSGVTDASIECYLTLARVKQAGGRNEEVQEIFDRLSETMIKNDNPEKIETVDADRVECQLGQGNTKDIEYWFNRIGLNSSGPNSSDESLTGRRRLLRNSGYVMLARYYYLTKKYDAELELLKKLLSFTELKGWVGQTIELLGLQALTFEAVGDSTTASQIIEKALSLAESEGYARAFLDKGSPMVQLLHENLISSKNSKFINTLLRLAPSHNQTGSESENILSTRTENKHEISASIDLSPHINPDSQNYDLTLFETLSDREVDILTLLAGRLSDKEIAEKLCLSINTVKSHNRSIYQKLGVEGRRQAVKKGMEFHLLEK